MRVRNVCFAYGKKRFSGLVGLVGSDHIVYNEAVREQVHGVQLQKPEGTYIKDDIL